MQRRFQPHDHRLVAHLEGFWDFAFLDQADPDAIQPRDIVFNDRAAVPGCFDALPRWAGRRGLAAYRRPIHLTDASPHRLFLDGVHHWCRVFLANRLIGEHAGGFTRFHLDITGHRAGPVDLIILVDNRIDPQRSPLHLDYYDWYHYGGITRGAELHRLGPCWIDALRITTCDFRIRQIRVELDCTSLSSSPAIPLRIACGTQVLLDESVALQAGANHLERTFTFHDAPLWSPSDPQLHLLHVQLNHDDFRQRFGIRQIALRGRDLCINDQPQRLLGFCRHEAHPQFGHAVPEQVLLTDLQLLAQMGCNFVRGAHYPQDPRFLDLCDEAGVCVWSEGTGWQNTASQLTDQRFLQAAETNLREMVAADINHPSIILWGALNEGHSHDPACRPGYTRLLDLLRKLDPSRPVTYASCFPEKDVCWDLADVLAVNTYPGWYVGEIDGIGEHLDRITAWLDAAGQSHKPLLISEIGAAAVYGCHDWNRQRWTEEYQSDLLARVIQHLFHDRRRACGLSIWQFCDIRSTQAIPMALGRARGFNNKGVLDEYRRPKLAFHTVRQAFHDAAGQSPGPVAAGALCSPPR